MRVSASVVVEASLAETWDAFFDRRGWPEWVDAFAGVNSSEGYPGEGGRLVWRTGTAGRGEISERVLAHEPRSMHRIAFSDPTMAGELETRFEIEGEGTRVTQTMDYRLAERGVFAFLGALFVRSQVARSLERSLAGLQAHVAEAAPR